MADKKPEKKFDKKSSAPAAPRALDIIIAEILIIGGVIIWIVSIVLGWFGVDFSTNTGVDSSSESFQRFFAGFLSSAQTISAFVSLLFLMGIIYAKFRIGQLTRAKKLASHIKNAEEKKQQKHEASENKKWKKVLEHVTSANSSDWRLSILEADILLGELLIKSGYKGEGIGDQLKGVERSDFHTLDLAWEAHKVRNRLAHDGSEFPLSQREARRVIGLFEEVFKEFHFI